MGDCEHHDGINRRGFLKSSAAVTAGAAAFQTVEAAAVPARKGMTTPGADGLIHGHEVEDMPYRKLGRTNFMPSRLVFGCGAALAGGKAVRLLESAYEAGINFYDIGSNVFYRGAEKHFAPFLKAHRDDIWVSSKAPLKALPDHAYGEPLSTAKGKELADHWSKLLDDSLKHLNTDYMDAYYLMMVDDPAVVKSEEIYRAFEKAKAAGKVGHYGVSTHKNAQDVLEAMIETGWYDIAMIAITPAGWYEWEKKGIKEDSPPLTELQEVLARAREAGIGLVGMKTARYLSMGSTPEDAFDPYYGAAAQDSGLNPFQRAYAYVLRHGVDIMNSDMQNYKHFEENVAAVQKADTVFA